MQMSTWNIKNLYSYEPKPSPRRRLMKYPDPKTPYEYCYDFHEMTGMDTGYYLKLSKGWPLDWFQTIISYCKTHPKDRIKQNIEINDFFKKYKESLVDKID